MSRRRATPVRTCIGCRRARPQAELLRLHRGADGRIEPDPRRRAGGRGAYVCRHESCWRQCVRKGPWAHAFRAPAVVTPEGVARLRGLLNEGSTVPAAVERGF